MSATKNIPPLQSGAVLLPQIRRRVQTGNWSPLDVDATVEVHGITWLRVHGGFGGRFDREDWIADLPGVSISVCDYRWDGSDFGPSYGTFENACREELKGGLRRARKSKAEAEEIAKELTSVIAQLEGILT